MQSVRIAALISTLSLTIAGGTLFFRLVERWSWLDSLFFTVVTLSTVGYGNLVPQTALGKIGTIVFIFLGLGVFAATIQQVTVFTIRAREQQARRAHAEAEAEEPGSRQDASDADRGVA